MLTTSGKTVTTCSPSSSATRIAPRATAARARAIPKATRSTSSIVRRPPPSLRLQSEPRQSVVVAHASSTSSSSSSSPSSLASKAAAAGPEVQAAVATLKRAAQRAWAVPTSDTLNAILTLEKAKLIQNDDETSSSSWLESIAGGREGRRWRLMFTSGTDQVRKAIAGDRAGGVYVPITAVQRWRLDDKLIENGIYLGFLGAFVFRGNWQATKNRLSFDFDAVKLRLGPWSKEFEIKKKQKESDEKKKVGAGPFFLFAYADDDICVARGRSGGVAMWARASADWQVKAGIDA